MTSLSIQMMERNLDTLTAELKRLQKIQKILDYALITAIVSSLFLVMCVWAYAYTSGQLALC